MRESAEGNPVQLAQTRANLAMLHLAQGRRQEALDNQLIALRILEDHLPPDHPELARPLANLGAIYAKLHRQHEAEEVLLRALLIARNGLGPGHAVCGGILSNYAQVLRQAHRKAEAKQAEILANAILESAEAGTLRRHTIDFSDLAKPANKH